MPYRDIYSLLEIEHCVLRGGGSKPKTSIAGFFIPSRSTEQGKDEIKRNFREASECSCKFRVVHKYVQDLEAQAAVFCNQIRKSDGKTAATSAAATVAAELRKRPSRSEILEQTIVVQSSEYAAKPAQSTWTQ